MVKARSRKRRSALKLLLALMLLAVLVAAGAAFAFVSSALKNLPALSGLEPKPSLTSFVYDCNGKVLAPLHAEEHRIPISIKRVPNHVRNAFIAVEDVRFYEHIGVDIKGIIRAAFNIVTGRQFQGGSTITQQLARAAFLTPTRRLERKIQEAFLAIELERKYTKDEILGMYLNIIPFGNGAYGIQAASQLYFGKNVEDLTIAEAALLAGMVQAPAAYDPYTHPQAARTRQAAVLQLMAKHGFISEAEADKAASSPLMFKPLKKSEIEWGAFFADYVLQQLLSRYSPETVYESGLQVYTTVDPEIQKAAEKAVATVLDPVFPMKPGEDYPEAAVVVMDPKTGYLKAIVGGRKHDRWLQQNRVVQSKRQPGSAFKPIAVYTAAMERGLTPSSVVDDSPVEWAQVSGPSWAPENYDRKFMGLMTIREALERSRNVVAVKVLDRIGVPTGCDYAEKLGITTLVRSPRNGMSDLNLSTGLGGLTDGVTPLDMTVAFGVFANGGIRQEPISIIKVVDKNGNVLEEHKPRGRPVIRPETAWIMTDMMKGTISKPWGTGTRAAIGRPAAGKTGTTSDWVDAWFCGYTPDLVTVVWMGYDKDKTMEKQRVTGGTYPAMIWKEVMSQAHKNIPPKDFPVPKGIVEGITVCTKSGKLPSPACPAETLKSEVFVKGTEPVDECDVHVLVDVCADNPAEIAGPFCPSRMTKGFIRRPEPYLVLEDGRKPLDADQEVPQQICRLHNPFIEPPVPPE
ncbi:MAG: penicillin-binding protein 1A [Firmicutes bacterium]|jgi:penicillin-binding protein 1A|nr:penicillin-binding protein 1A [Bacillota bacterium]